VQQFLFDRDWQRRFPFLVASASAQQTTTASTQAVSDQKSGGQNVRPNAVADRQEGQVQS
jgi:hypothetical protein